MQMGYLMSLIEVRDLGFRDSPADLNIGPGSRGGGNNI